LLDGNPLEGIANTRRIYGVIRKGLYLDRASLDGMLAGAKGTAAAAN